MPPYGPKLSIYDKFIKKFAPYGFLKRTHVLYCSWNGKLYCNVAAKSFKMANGIEISHDKKELYVADTVGKSVHIFDRKEDNSLTRKHVINVELAPDNIKWNN